MRKFWLHFWCSAKLKHSCDVVAKLLGFQHNTSNQQIVSYLVDPASSHTLVLKIKPCMSKCGDLHSLDCGRLIRTVIVYLMVPFTWITVVILELIHAKMGDPVEAQHLLDPSHRPRALLEDS